MSKLSESQAPIVVGADMSTVGTKGTVGLRTTCDTAAEVGHCEQLLISAATFVPVWTESHKAVRRCGSKEMTLFIASLAPLSAALVAPVALAPVAW